MSPANGNSARAISSAAPGESTVGEGTVSRARIDRLRNSMPGGDSLLDELIDLFVLDLPTRLSAIAQAIERADAPDLALQAHALRGGAANFGACHLDELCGKLEQIGVRDALAEASAMLDPLGRESAQVRDALLALRSQYPTAPPTGRRSSPA